MIGWVTPQDYGAAGDGVTNDSPAFQAALNSGYPVWVPYTPNGYALFSTVFLYGLVAGTNNPNWQILQGDRGVKLLASYPAGGSFSGNALLSVGPNPGVTNGWYVQVSGFTLDLANASAPPNPGAGTYPPAAIFLNRSANPAGTLLDYHYYSDLLFQHCYYGITDVATDFGSTSVDQNACMEMQFLNCRFWITKGGPQFIMNKTDGFLLLRDFHVDLVPNLGSYLTTPFIQFGPVTMNGYQLPGALDGVELERVDVNGGLGYTGGFPAITIAGNDTTTTGLGRAIFLRRVLVDGYPGPGIVLRNLDNVFGADVQTYTTSGSSANGIDLEGLFNCYFVNIIGYDTSADGIKVISCANVQMTNVRADDNTNYGLRVENSLQQATNCNFSNVQVLDNKYHGLFVHFANSCNFSNLQSVDNGTLESIYYYGIYVLQCSYVQLTNAQTNVNKSHGFVFYDSTYCHLTNATSLQNTGIGFLEDADAGSSSISCDGNIAVNARADANSVHSLYINGSHAPDSAFLDWNAVTGYFRGIDIGGTTV